MIVSDDSHDMLVAKRYDLELRLPAKDDPDYADILNFEQLSMFKKSCVGYIAGYVVRMVRRTLKRMECLDALRINNDEGPQSTCVQPYQNQEQGWPHSSLTQCHSVCEET